MAEEKENFILRAGLWWSQGLWEETERKEGIISALDKNDSGLIFKFCLEFKPPGDCSLWRWQEHRFKGMPSWPGRSRRTQSPAHAGKHVRRPREELGLQRPFLIWTFRACVLPTDVFHCCYVALIKVANNCDHSVTPAAFHCVSYHRFNCWESCSHWHYSSTFLCWLPSKPPDLLHIRTDQPLIIPMAFNHHGLCA